jgi:hypothetical protein
MPALDFTPLIFLPTNLPVAALSKRVSRSTSEKGLNHHGATHSASDSFLILDVPGIMREACRPKAACKSFWQRHAPHGSDIIRRFETKRPVLEGMVSPDLSVSMLRP